MYEDMTFENILKRALDRVNNSIDKRQGSIIYDSIAPAAAELALTYIEMDFIHGKLDAENLFEDELELFVGQRTGMQRKQATKAIRKGIFSKADGSFFNVETGSRFTGEDLYYKVMEKINDGEFKLECEEPGDVGNDYVGPLMPVDYIDGLAKAEVTDILVPGYNAESDLSLLTRYYERIRTPVTSGNIYHYRNWAKEVEGVGDVKVIPLWAGDNTVKVVIVDDNMLPAEPGLVEKVQNYIDPGSKGLGEGQAPIGAFCTVVSATGKAIDITFKVTRDANYTVGQIKDNVENNIKEYLKSIAFKEDMVSYAKIGAIILDSEGVLDYTDLKVNNGISNIAIGNEEVAVLGEVTINE